MPELNIYQKNLEYLQSKGLLRSITTNSDSLEHLLRVAQETSIPVEQLLYKNLRQRENFRHRKIKMLVMDCDGVLTDGAMIFTKNQDEIKRFNAKDGQGIKRWMAEGKMTGLISAGISTGLVEKRAEMLGIPHVYVGKTPKMDILRAWSEELGIALSEMAYIGDDITDIPILEKAGISACPADAVAAVKKTSELVLSLKGGEGCVRELIDDYLLVEE